MTVLERACYDFELCERVCSRRIDNNPGIFVRLDAADQICAHLAGHCAAGIAREVIRACEFLAKAHEVEIGRYSLLGYIKHLIAWASHRNI